MLFLLLISVIVLPYELPEGNVCRNEMLVTCACGTWQKTQFCFPQASVCLGNLSEEANSLKPRSWFSTPYMGSSKVASTWQSFSIHSGCTDLAVLA